MKPLKLIASVCVVVAGILIGFNAALPYGNHILIAYHLKRDASAFDGVVYNGFYSRAYLAIAGISCTYRANGLTDVLDRQDVVYQAVPASFVLYDLYGRGLDGEYADEYDGYVSRVISGCDIEAKLHNDAPPPIIYAILTGKIQYVKQLVARGVSMDFRMNRPGAESDKMGPKDYAKYLELKFKDSKESSSYKEIAEYLNGL
jgi:hypothetical protein